MCGICGKVINGNDDLQSVASMNQMLKHRGPDDGGVHYAPSAALGIRRLSIIDLETGQQPLFNEDETVAVVLNGEIYNYLDLRNKLEGAGHRFASRSDTEVIAHLYEEKGTNCVEDLRGMFAFALWDSRKQQLMLARDRLGKKPLFYLQNGNVLIFASELKGLIQDNSWNQVIDPSSIAVYLDLGYIPSSRSIFNNVSKLQPGHALTWRNGHSTIWKYWNLELSPKLPINDENELLEELDTRLREAVGIRLMSDVPLGALLSGGIDSSLVVAIMADMMDEPVQTFAIGFEQESHNELPYARQIAERFGTKHTEFMVNEDAIENLPKLVWHLDEPFADPSALPTFQVSKLAREHVTVVLNGDGGDELFGGYYRFRSEFWTLAAAQVPKAVRSAMYGALSYLPMNNHGSPQSRLQRIMMRSFLDFRSRYAGYHSLLSSAQRQDLIHPDFLAKNNIEVGNQYVVDYISSLPSMDPMDLAFAVELGLYLPDDLLVKMDRMSMANGLEARSPMLDQEFVAWAAKLPLSFKLRGLTTKYLLRKLAARYLPKNIANREKQGFSVPCDDWFRGELKDMAYDVLLSRRSKERGYFRMDQVQKMLDDHQVGYRHDWGHQIWMLLMLELWHQQFVDNGAALAANRRSSKEFTL